jgi:hypothetical protein
VHRSLQLLFTSGQPLQTSLAVNMGRVRKSLVQKLLRAADSPIFDLPKSWHVLSR